jgi:hypothetical protein
MEFLMELILAGNFQELINKFVGILATNKNRNMLVFERDLALLAKEKQFILISPCIDTLTRLIGIYEGE